MTGFLLIFGGIAVLLWFVFGPEMGARPLLRKKPEGSPADGDHQEQLTPTHLPTVISDLESRNPLSRAAQVRHSTSTAKGATEITRTNTDLMCHERIERECLRSWRSGRCFLPSDEADAIVTERRAWLFKTVGKTGADEEDASTPGEAEAPSRRAIMLEPMIQQISTMKIRVEDLELQPRDIENSIWGPCWPGKANCTTCSKVT